ncbi:MAG: ATP-binding cassette domain-containing protein, partial [Gammaproteobacteria bacterium]
MSALAVKGLTKTFSGLKVITDLSLTVEPGERRLIIGPNGAGKTTLFNLITGEFRADKGTVHMFDQEITRVPARRRPHLGMTRTYQIITLFPDDTLLRNVSLSLLGRSRVRWNPFLRFATQKALMSEALEVLARVGLAEQPDRLLRETAYGEQRRVEIAMALAQAPRILLLDEPFAGLSIEERLEIKKLLLSIPKEVTIVMIEHDMEMALDFAEQV